MLPERILRALDVDYPGAGSADPEGEDPADGRDEIAQAVDAFLEAPFSEVEPYARYVSGQTRFDTHQGVKGLEFPRVMVVMDDHEARGFQFKYEKLFGPAAVDDRVEASTRRLFYVTCSRAERSLALVAYAQDPAAVRAHVLAQGWFEPDEVLVGLPPTATATSP